MIGNGKRRLLLGQIPRWEELFAVVDENAFSILQAFTYLVQASREYSLYRKTTIITYSAFPEVPLVVFLTFATEKVSL